MADLERFHAESKVSLPDTALTATKVSLLVDAINDSNKFNAPVVEIGSYRGATTCVLAAATTRQIYAVDPYIGYGGNNQDECIFRQRAAQHQNITHLRLTSGQALARPECQSVSMVFVDAVNDYANFWFNCVCWMNRIMPGGLLAVNQVDEWPGPNLACRRLLRLKSRIAAWGYCEDLIVFKRL